MFFEPVWLSTPEHLDKFYRLYSSASTFEKSCGVYNFPEGFPHADMFWGVLPFLRIPVVAVASGTMSVESGGIHFRAKPMQVFGSRIRNLQTNLEFHIRTDELTSIRRDPATSTGSQYFNLPFTRICSSQAGLTGDFLVCIGGPGPFMGKIKAGSDLLFAALEKLAPQYQK